MCKYQDLIVEIGTEELPSICINQILTTFKQQLINEFNLKNLTFQRVIPLATPRRIALLVEQLSIQQPEHIKIKKGPSLAIAYDIKGQPTKALIGFIDSLKINLHELSIVRDEQQNTSWVEYRAIVIGDFTIKLLPEIINNATKDLPGPKMSWGEGDMVFVRPVHWVLAMFGTNNINCNLFGIKSGLFTYGHRFMANQPIKINEPREYQDKLKNIGKVIVDPNYRKQLIVNGIQEIEQKLNAKCMLDTDLLEQVTNMVEFPEVLCANFEEKFLQLPYECLILVMKHHQKTFALLDQENKLLPKFILISNISNDKAKENIILGNQKVMHARLEDAMFLYKQDINTPISSMLEKLKTVVLQEKLGSLYEQSVRIKDIGLKICKLLHATTEQQFTVQQGGLLCKFDLVSKLVMEFPELQGIMGRYYLKLQQFDEEVATAVAEHYLPKLAEGELPASASGICIAIAARLNLLCGMFLIGLIPTGDKDPFGLRRACLGIIRILVEKKLSLSIIGLFEITIATYEKSIIISLDPKIKNQQLIANEFKENQSSVAEKLLNFTLERLKYWYITNIDNFNVHYLYAVLDNNYSNNNVDCYNYDLYDIDLRLKALINFSYDREFVNFIAANKRIANLCDKLNTIEMAIIRLKPINFSTYSNIIIDVGLFQTLEERLLYTEIIKSKDIVLSLLEEHNYLLILQNLLNLVPLVNDFFDNVMVMVDEQRIKENRILLLFKIKLLFSCVACMDKL